MSNNKKPLIRAALIKSQDGMKVREIAEIAGIRSTSVAATLKHMPDVYIDRWERTEFGTGGLGGYMPIYCAARIPENCPHPTRG